MELEELEGALLAAASGDHSPMSPLSPTERSRHRERHGGRGSPSFSSSPSVSGAMSPSFSGAASPTVYGYKGSSLSSRRTGSAVITASMRSAKETVKGASLQGGSATPPRAGGQAPEPNSDALDASRLELSGQSSSPKGLRDRSAIHPRHLSHGGAQTTEGPASTAWCSEVDARLESLDAKLDRLLACFERTGAAHGHEPEPPLLQNAAAGVRRSAAWQAP